MHVSDGTCLFYFSILFVFWLNCFVPFNYRTLTLQCTATCSALQLLTVWLHEMYWAYAGKMTSAVDRDVYTDCVSTTIRKYFCDHQLVSNTSCEVHTCEGLLFHETIKEAFIYQHIHVHVHI